MATNDASMTRRERLWGLLVTVGIVTAVAVPGARTLVESDAADGFPLSTYPMFVADRGRVVQQATVVSADADVTEPIEPSDPVDRLSPSEIARTDQVIQAGATVRDAIRQGASATRELCEDVAGHVAAPAVVVVVTETYDPIGWAEDNSVDPVERLEHTRCEATG